MDFAAILDRWDKSAGTVYDKDAASALAEAPASRRRRLLRQRPGAVIDLHGLGRDEAWNALESFFAEAKNRGLEKVLLIHGKGSHGTEGKPDHAGTPGETGVLKKLVRDFIEHCPCAGESGHSSARAGGSGATWVLLKASVPGR